VFFDLTKTIANSMAYVSVVTDHVPLMVPLLEEALKAWDANPPAA